ncbi:MAG: response regulator transcription factor [Pseudolabrys sp.]
MPGFLNLLVRASTRSRRRVAIVQAGRPMIANSRITQQARPELFLVDDDFHIRDLLSIVFEMAGYRLTSFGESESFLTEARNRTPACVILDIHLPGCSGLDALTKVDAHHFGAPIVIMSAQGEIPVVVDAIKRGAFDFIEKPFDTEVLIARVGAAIDGWNRKEIAGHAAARQPHSFRGQDLLTRRECEVLAQIAKGDSNKEAARQLGISPRTVEVHRFRIMDKLQAKNVADLMRIVLSRDASTGARSRAIGLSV